MPIQAVALLLTLLAIGLVAGIAMAWIAGPRRWWAPIVPVIVAILAMDLSGHRLGLELGPTVDLYGFRVALPWDATVAALAAAVAAVVQRIVVARRLRG